MSEAYEKKLYFVVCAAGGKAVTCGDTYTDVIRAVRAHVAPGVKEIQLRTCTVRTTKQGLPRYLFPAVRFGPTKDTQEAWFYVVSWEWLQFALRSFTTSEGFDVQVTDVGIVPVILAEPGEAVPT